MRRMLAIFAFAMLLVPSHPAVASLARAISFDEKVAAADQIFLGRVIRTHSAFDSSGRWIVTYSTFQVERNFKGGPEGEVTLVTPGGRVGSLHQETVGVPSFGAGESNIVFVRRAEPGATVLYFDQGAYRVDTDGSGETIVRPVPSELVLLDPSSGKAGSTADEGVRTLEEFERAVRSSLRDIERRSR
jgi:hypothetical protein